MKVAGESGTAHSCCIHTGWIELRAFQSIKGSALGVNIVIAALAGQQA